VRLPGELLSWRRIRVGCAILLAIEMAVAIVKVHSVHGIMALREYAFPLVLASAALALATVGAGLLSADYLALGEGRHGRARSSKSSKD